MKDVQQFFCTDFSVRNNRMIAGTKLAYTGGVKNVAAELFSF